MGRSEWICRTCGLGFDTKGKRDGHREREHRQSVPVILCGSRNQILYQSEAGMFVCQCGKQYQTSWTWRRHSVSCKAWILDIQSDVESTEYDEGILPFPIDWVS